jgi:hypothetical protein
MKYFLYLALSSVTLMSCNENKNAIEKLDKKISNSSSQPVNQDTLSLDTAMIIDAIPPKQGAKFNSVFPLGTFRTFPQIVRSLFGEGSKSAEVRDVMGSPELIDDSRTGHEIWYYGNVEIHFKYDIVSEVVNSQQCERYAQMISLCMSSDPIERKFGEMLLKRTAFIDKFE